jgi:hypothetical protein
MAELAYIYDGFTSGSTTVSIRCFDTDGLTILLYRGYDLLGTGTLIDSDCQISLSQPLTNTGESLIAYVDEVGMRTGGCQQILDSGIDATGWEYPLNVIIDGESQSYEDYLADGNRELPDRWNPQVTKNITPETESLKSFALANIDCDLLITETYGTTIITVSNVKNARGGYTIQFDGGTIGSTTTKTYTVSGSYQVKIQDLGSSNFVIKTYSFTIIPSSTPPSTAIEQFWCYKDYNTSFAGNTASLNGYCSSKLQFRIDGILGSTWVDGISGGNDRWYYIFGNVGTGAKVVRSRVKSTPSDTIFINITY